MYLELQKAFWSIIYSSQRFKLTQHDILDQNIKHFLRIWLFVKLKKYNENRESKMQKFKKWSHSLDYKIDNLINEWLIIPYNGQVSIYN